MNLELVRGLVCSRANVDLSGGVTDQISLGIWNGLLDNPNNITGNKLTFKQNLPENRHKNNNVSSTNLIQRKTKTHISGALPYTASDWHQRNLSDTTA